ncbi:MAG: hypothetical protein IKN90_09560 [Treponema sp.]|nr:hypothetical protein [Treponema sp.]
MKQMGINRTFFAFAIFAALFSITACKKETKIKTYVSSAETLNIKVRSTKPDQVVSAKNIRSHGHAEDGEVCVLFGYGFNSENFYSQVIHNLDTLYGLEENDGMILPVIFPNDIKKISLLRDMLNERNIRGVVILGAPEGTNSVFARLQDEYDGKIPYPVFSLFPQDDILGQESTCDFVLEYERKVEEESMEEQILQHIDSDASEIIMRTIAFILNCEDESSPYDEKPASEKDSRKTLTLAPDESLHGFVQKIVGTRKVIRYTDSETLIPSSNHFVIERSQESES